MDAHQLIDSLTSHISFYHLSSSNPNPNPNPRSSILKWFSSLTIDQRQSHLTTVDPNFVYILLCMQTKLISHGHGFFFLLPDLPSSSSSSLPTLCFRKSHGLLSRVSQKNDLNRSVSESVRLFGSKEGEDANECSCSIRGLDSMTMCEGFVSNVDRFVEVMDGVSNGGFLRGDETGLGDDWVEMNWLKAKGYYTVDAFVANRLEVALRLAWLNCNNIGKKRGGGVKLKEKASAAAASVGVAVNVFRRKKGCVNWWGALDPTTKRKAFSLVLGNSAKSLTDEILKGANDDMGDEKWILSIGPEQTLRYNSTVSSQRTIAAPSFDAEVGVTIIQATVFGKLNRFSNAFNGLLVLQEILSMFSSCQHSEFSTEKLFFSTLGSVSTVSDCVLRKLRGLLMVVSLDYTKRELLGEGNLKSSQNKLKGSVGAGKRRKKGRTRNLKKENDAPSFQGDDLTRRKFLGDQGCGLARAENAGFVECSSISQGKHVKRETSQEHANELVDENIQCSARKNRKGRTKNKSCSLIEKKNLKTRTSKVSSSSDVSPGEGGKSSHESGASVPNITSDNSTGITDPEPNSSSCNSFHELIWKDDDEGSIHGDFVVGFSKRSYNPGSECDQLIHSVIEKHSMPSRSNSTSHDTLPKKNTSSLAGLKCCSFTNDVIENGITSTASETLNCPADCNIISHANYVLENDIVSNESITFSDSRELNESDKKSALSVNAVNAENSEKTVMLKGQESGNLYDNRPRSSVECPPYEWPSPGCVAPVHFPSLNSQHLPAATDRLHLDVGHNWHNHFHQAFVPAMHQASNPPIEGGCSRVLSRQMPMSLDWPPMIRSISGLAPSMTYNSDSGFVSTRQSSYWPGFATNSLQLNAASNEAERKYSGDLVDMSDLPNTLELAYEYDNYLPSEEEFEMRAVSGVDYSQYFGGGVMYWNPSDHPGTGFSRPPSLSSDDSSWAWHEADMNRAVDDMVAFSSSYSTNGLTSPTATPFCSSFDSLGPGHQALGYVIPAKEITAKVLHPSSTLSDSVVAEKASGSLASFSEDIEGKIGDSLPYPILRPIIIPNISRERSRSEFRHSHEHRSPCVPLARREQPRIKRPPSPVVLCVPRAPHPPSPSPTSDSRKHRGFSTVRSGSSSPRHWGMRGWYQDGSNFEEASVCIDGTEVVWPAWRNKNLSAHPVIQPLPLPGTLLQDRLMAISQLTRDQEHPDVAFPLQPADLANCPIQKASLSLMQSLLHDEIDSFCKRVAAENMIRRPYINWAVKRVTRSLQVLWPRSRSNIFGSNATGLSLPTSDVDLVVCLPPVRNLEPIKEAGILEGRNGIKETCLQHAARYLANQEWVKSDSLKTVENTAIPIIMLVVEVPDDIITPGASNSYTPKEELTQITSEQKKHVHIDSVSLENSIFPKCSEINSHNGNDLKAIRLDISFKSSSHTGLQTTELVKELTDRFPAAAPLALVLKKFLADRSLDQSYSGGLSSYCLVLLIIRFLQHQHHLGRPINQNYGSLLMDFLYFFGNVFDPRQMRISVLGTGVYINREKGYSIDPIHIDDPLFPTNNVGRNCFRIHQCIKAFSDAFAVLENELTCLSNEGDSNTRPLHRILDKIVPSIDHL